MDGANLYQWQQNKKERYRNPGKALRLHLHRDFIERHFITSQ
jgi:hypothetical protein